MHTQVLLDPTELYSPEDLEKRRLQNWAEEKIADQEAKQLQEYPAAPEENEVHCKVHAAMECQAGLPARDQP